MNETTAPNTASVAILRPWNRPVGIFINSQQAYRFMRHALSGRQKSVKETELCHVKFR
jgi:hypothetical protein